MDRDGTILSSILLAGCAFFLSLPNVLIHIQIVAFAGLCGALGLCGLFAAQDKYDPV